MGTGQVGAYSDDHGSIVIGWLTRVALVVAILGIIGFDVIAVGQGRINAGDEADQIAQDAHQSWSDNHSVDKAYTVARTEAAANGDAVVAGGFSIQPKTGLVTVKIRHTVDTIVFKHFGFTRNWTTMVATGHAQDQT